MAGDILGCILERQVDVDFRENYDHTSRYRNLTPLQKVCWKVIDPEPPTKGKALNLTQAHNYIAQLLAAGADVNLTGPNPLLVEQKWEPTPLTNVQIAEEPGMPLFHHLFDVSVNSGRDSHSHATVVELAQQMSTSATFDPGIVCMGTPLLLRVLHSCLGVGSDLPDHGNLSSRHVPSLHSPPPRCLLPHNTLHYTTMHRDE